MFNLHTNWVFVSCLNLEGIFLFEDLRQMLLLCLYSCDIHGLQQLRVTLVTQVNFFVVSGVRSWYKFDRLCKFIGASFTFLVGHGGDVNRGRDSVVQFLGLDDILYFLHNNRSLR